MPRAKNAAPKIGDNTKVKLTDARAIHEASLSAVQARELLSYDAESGSLHWLVRAAQRARPGGAAGYRPAGQHARISIHGRLFLAHRVIWLIVTGEWPRNQVDHADGDPGNNRWCNLREATPAQNCQNARRRCDNKSGFKGVDFNKRQGRWRARVQAAGRSISLGYFDTAEAAAEAYAIAAARFHGQFARAA